MQEPGSVYPFEVQEALPAFRTVQTLSQTLAVACPVQTKPA